MKRYRPVFLALIALLLSQMACQAAQRIVSPQDATPVVVYVTPTPQVVIVTPAPEATLLPATDSFNDELIKAGIQSALDLYARAYNENDPSLLEQAVDQENAPFRRLARSRFDDFQRSSSAGRFSFEYTLLDIERRDMGFIIAHFDFNGGYQADWPFRWDAGTNRWVLTEPTVEQLGEPVTTETDHFTFITYPWADNVNQQIMDMMETARAQVEATLGAAPEEKAVVRLVPNYGLEPFGAPQAIAWYSKGGDPSGRDLIHIYTPQSFTFAYYDPDLGWDGTLQRTLTHEYTHMAHARNFDRAGRLADWMSEGLAEYVAQEPGNVAWACYNFQRDTIIPILDESDAVYKQDLMHMTNLQKDTGLAYAVSHALVQFTVEEFDGLDGFWALARSIDQTSDFKKAVQQTYGISYEEFNSLWEKWLKKQC